MTTWNGSSCSAYINGVNNTTSGAAPSFSGAGMMIGDYNGHYFGGLIADVRIYNRALTAAQIAAMYAGGD